MSLREDEVDRAASEEELVLAHEDPLALFEAWLSLAHEKEINDANAMALATVDDDGLPNVRMVLLKDHDRDGIVFYTNIQSRKGVELLGARKAAAVFHWKSLRRQVRFRGTVTLVSDQEADEYFGSRSHQSRIGAWASQQSRPLPSRFALMQAVAANTARFGLGSIPRPPHWTGFRIAPISVEFWMDKPFRLHDRLMFSRPRPSGPWTVEKLFP